MSKREKNLLADDFCQSVYQMMTAYEQVDGKGWEKHNLREVEEPSSRTLHLRRELMWEEFEEYLQATKRSDLVEVADALGDMMVIIAGTAIAYNIDLPAVLAEIQRSNMAKVDPETGKVLKRDDGKALKPEGWTPPDIERFM